MRAIAIIGGGVLVACALVACALVTACGQADPTVFRPGFGDHGSASSSAGDGGVDATGDAAAEGDAIATDASRDAHVDADPPAPHDGGPDADASADAGADASDAAITAFTGAPAYAPTTGPSTLNAAHNFGGATPTNPAGQACLGCHAAGGPAVEFTIGGTVWKDTGGTIPAPQVEVAVRDNAGATRAAYTDANGNFFVLRSDAGALAPPARAGVRDATTTISMSGALAAGNCNDCHKTGGQTPIHVP